jgi:hypothetical protein
MKTGTRGIVDQEITQWSDLGAFGEEEDPQFTRRGEKEKELLVVVKRNRGIDIIQRDATINKWGIRQWAEDWTRQEIK